MKGEFEKNIENKLSYFKLEPSAQVWLDVEDALRQRNKRRIASWWWLIIPVLFFLISGSIWWMNYNNKEITSSAKTIILLNKNNIITGVPKLKTDSSIVGHTDINSFAKSGQIKSNKKNNGEIIIADNRKEKLASNNPKSEHQLINEDHQGNRNNRVNDKDVSVAKNNKKNSRVNIITTPTIWEKTTNSDQGEINNRSTTKKIVLDSNKQNDSSIVNQSTKENTINVVQREASKTASSDKNVLAKGKQKDSLLFISNAGINNDHKQSRQNKNHWFITVGGGLIKLKEGTSLFSTNQYATSPSQSTGVSNGGGSSASRSIPQANNGYSFGAGFLYCQSINTRWAINVGVQYHYLQSTQNVGLDSLPINSAQTYFSNIQSVGSKTNYAHWIQLPVSLQYTFNPSSKYQLQFSGGGSIAWAVAEQWLIIDKTNASFPYHYNSSLNNRFLANLHAGIGLNCNNKFRLSLLAEQSLTPIHKNTTEKFYWQQLSLQISKPLHISSKQNN